MKSRIKVHARYIFVPPSFALLLLAGCATRSDGPSGTISELPESTTRTPGISAPDRTTYGKAPVMAAEALQFKVESAPAPDVPESAPSIGSPEVKVPDPPEIDRANVPDPPEIDQ